jgi:hypothetical protein
MPTPLNCSKSNFVIITSQNVKNVKNEKNELIFVIGEPNIVVFQVLRIFGGFQNLKIFGVPLGG